MSMEPMEPFESAANFNEDVGLFEAATHCAAVEIAPPPLATIAAALDGSPRDETLRGFAEALAARTGARVEFLDGSATATAILAELAEHPADLLILPVPFGQDYRELGSESLGSVVDQLLLKVRSAVLCVREPQDPAAIQAALDSVIVPIAIADELAPRALSWAFRVTPAGGRVDLVAVADRDVLAEASHLVSEGSELATLNPAQLSRALLRDIGSLVAAAQKRGRAEDRTIHVETRIGQFVPLILAEMHGRPHMIVWGITRDHGSPAFHRAVDLLLSSTGPVLMV